MTDDVQPTHRLRLTMAIALAVIAIDQLTKHWAVNALTDEPPRHVIWTLQWNLTFNSGMAFSKGVRKNSNPMVAIAAGFVVGGAVGNLIDRLFRGDGWLHGSVVDFIDFQWFPIFNVADMAVNAGGVMFVLWSLFSKQEAVT